VSRLSASVRIAKLPVLQLIEALPAHVPRLS
jgi:hypothetical protein